MYPTIYDPLAQKQADQAASGYTVTTPSGSNTNFWADVADSVGSFLGLPEIGISEALAGGQPTARTANPVGVDITESPIAYGLGTNAPYQEAINSLPISTTTGTPSTVTSGTGDNGSVLDYSPNGGYTTGGGYSSADEAAYYQDQIDQLNSLLGFIGIQKQKGLENLRTGFDVAKTRGAQTYDEQSLRNAQAKEQGVESVGQFANDSYTNLKRVLQGANAGSSSVARELMPYLVSKAAGTRRQGVFDTAGENERNITMARTKFDEDLENQNRASEQSFQQNMLSEQNRIENELRNAEIAKAQATGLGYAQARQAGEATRNSISARQQELASLFDKYKPTYSTAQAPDLKSFTVDKANIQQGQNTPAESSYYLPQIKKFKELQG